jgi:hypothetical protein
MSTDPLPEIWLTMWRRLPLLVAMDVLLCLAIAPVVGLVLVGLWLPALLCAVVLIGPAWAGCATVSDELARNGADADVGMRTLLRAVLTHGRDGVVVVATPVAVAGLTWSTLQLRAAAPDQSWLLASLGVDCTVLVLATAAALPAFSLRVSAHLRGRALWRTALAVLAVSPLQVAGLAAICVLAWVLSGVVGGGLLFLLPGPLVLLVSGTTWSAVNRSTRLVRSAPRR